MYQLVSHVADGLGKLKSLLEKHICTQGLSAIEKCGESALNVSSTVIIVTLRYRFLKYRFLITAVAKISSFFT